MVDKSGRHLRGIYCVFGAVLGFYIPFITLVLRDRGFSKAEIGFVLSAMALAGVAMSPLWSDVADNRLGTTLTLRIVLLGAAVMTEALIVAGNDHLAVIIAAAGLGACLAPNAALLDAATLHHLGESGAASYGDIRLWASGAFATATLLFGALVQLSGVGLVLPVFAIGLLIYAASTLPLPSARPVRAGSTSRFGAAAVALRTVPGLRPFLLGLLLTSGAAATAWNFAPLRITESGGGPFLVGLSFALAAYIEVPFMRSGRRLGERFGLPRVYVSGVAVYVLLMLLWSITSDPVVITVTTAIRGAGFGLSYVALVVLMGRLVPPSLRNSGQVLMQTASGFGPVLGQAVGGVVYSRLGPSVFFAGAAVVAAAGAGVIWRVLARLPDSGVPASTPLSIAAVED